MQDHYKSNLEGQILNNQGRKQNELDAKRSADNEYRQRVELLKDEDKQKRAQLQGKKKEIFMSEIKDQLARN